MSQWQPQHDPQQQQPPPGWQQAQPPQYQPPAYGQPVPAPRAPRRAIRTGCTVLLVFAVVITVLLTVFGGSHGSGSFKATVGNFAVINPADLAVTVHVTNTGSSAATPTCTVKANDPSYAYTGIDIGTLQNPVPAHATDTYVDNVTITGQGAAYVTDVTVSC